MYPTAPTFNWDMLQNTIPKLIEDNPSLGLFGLGVIAALGLGAVVWVGIKIGSKLVSIERRRNEQKKAIEVE